jgi:hypothetical protein
MTLREQFGKPVLFHLLVWHGKDGTSLTGYDSRDPNVITHQLEAMSAYGGEGFGVIVLSFGLTSAFIQQATLEVANQCNALKIPFALCFDPWTVKNPDGSMPPVAERNKRMIATLKDPSFQVLLNLDCYIEERYVLDFAINCDKNVIMAAVPNINYLLDGPDFDWPRIPPQPNKTNLPCTYIEFNDGTGPDRNKSVHDQTKPCRITPSYAGGTFWSNNIKAGDYVQFATWNDIKEGTDCEKFASTISVKIGA